MARAGTLLTLLTLFTGCSALPNMDLGSSGCQNARGIGPAGMTTFDGEPVVAGVVGKSPVEAAAVARAMGHTVVFNVQIPGYGECWCVPPPEGQVVSAWWGQHGALWLEVDGVDEGHTQGTISPSGAGAAKQEGVRLGAGGATGRRVRI